MLFLIVLLLFNFFYRTYFLCYFSYFKWAIQIHPILPTHPDLISGSDSAFGGGMLIFRATLALFSAKIYSISALARYNVVKLSNCFLIWLVRGRREIRRMLIVMAQVLLVQLCH